MDGLLPGPVTVSVPATSANLGPGFDSFGLALDLRDRVTVEVADELEIVVTGEGAGVVPTDGRHLVHRSVSEGLARLGFHVPPLRLHCENQIPHARGLGSSSAAIVAGLAAARAMVPDGAGRLDDEALCAVAAELEGHPDNVAPAVHGSFTIAWRGRERFQAVSLEVDARVALTTFVPPQGVETTVARGLLPETVAHRDAAANSGRAALLVAALTGRPDLLLAATEDLLHQGYRAPAMPNTVALVERLRDDGVAAVISGAGPSVLALTAHADQADLWEHCPPGWAVTLRRVDVDGVRVEGSARRPAPAGP